MYINKKRRSPETKGSLYSRSLDEIPEIPIDQNVSELHQHPDREWLQSIIDWAVVGKLYFRTKQNTVDHDILKQYFAKLNIHMNGRLDWRNVPVFWRWRCPRNTRRIYVQFLLYRHTESHTIGYGHNLHTVVGFDCLEGQINRFQGLGELCGWLKKEWSYGTSHIFPMTDLKESVDSITRTDEEIWDTCYSPHIHHLKKNYLKKINLKNTDVLR